MGRPVAKSCQEAKKRGGGGLSERTKKQARKGERGAQPVTHLRERKRGTTRVKEIILDGRVARRQRKVLAKQKKFRK